MCVQPNCQEIISFKVEQIRKHAGFQINLLSETFCPACGYHYKDAAQFISLINNFTLFMDDMDEFLKLSDEERIEALRIITNPDYRKSED